MLKLDAKIEVKDFEKRYDKLAPCDLNLKEALQELVKYCKLFIEKDSIEIHYWIEKLEYMKSTLLNIELLTKRVITDITKDENE